MPHRSDGGFVLAAAFVKNDSDVSVMPQIQGIPGLAGRLPIDTETDVASGRYIVFDAAGKVHYVSRDTATYRALSPCAQALAVI